MILLLQLLGGFVLLLAGGEALVRGAVAIARRLGVSPFVIGLTLVAFGTSMPELVTSIEAALAGAPGIAVGNIVGSNIANVLLIVGVAALLRPLVCDPRGFYRDGSVLAGATLLCVPIALLGGADRPIGIGLVVLLLVYTVATYMLDKRGDDPAAAVHSGEADVVGPGPRSLAVALLMAVGGIAVTVLGARLLVAGAVEIAREFGVSEAVVGLTIVAVGTSLPELTTAIVASLRGQSDVALGNVIGSNIFNILGILGVTAIVTPLAVPDEIVSFDLGVMVGVTAVLIFVAVSGWRVTRSEGLLLLAGYATYIGWLAAGV
ncbi:MAG: calcium/sodium antiporter [Alphaproteobacteria bacterium]